MTKEEILRQYFGYSQFRQGQEMLIDSILAGTDTLGIMPTGAGKSICYQVPALIFQGITLVISPLISLMKDQVGALNAAGVHAAYLNSSLTQGQYFKALDFARQGRYPIIYVAPERLLTDSRLPMGTGFQAKLFKDRGVYRPAEKTSGDQRIYSYRNQAGSGGYYPDFEASGANGADHRL